MSDLEHAEFCWRLGDGTVFCTVRDPQRAMWLAWGARGVASRILAAGLVLIPMVAVGLLATSAGELAWVAPCLVGFVLAPACLNAIDGLPFLVCPLIGAFVVLWAGPFHFFAGFAPPVSWALSGARRGMAVNVFLESMVESESLFETLQEAGLVSFSAQAQADAS